MVQIEKLNFYYKKESPIFSDFSWRFAPGERWSVIGPSGCGKTTLLYLIAGLRKPLAGNININRQKYFTGLILQDYGLLPWATAKENVSLGLKIRGADKQKTRETAQKWMHNLDIEEVAEHYPSELSGGQRQRVAIARTMAIEPSLLLMDEPFSSLDTVNREELLNLAMGLWKELSSTIVMVTHNIEEAVFWGSKILVLNYPPNVQTIIIENTLSGSSNYRHTADFTEKCRELQAIAGQNSKNGKITFNNE